MSIFRRPFRYSFFHAVFYIIGLNLLAFLAQNVVKEATFYLALVPPLALHGYPPLNFPWLWQFVTYMFAHGGWRHILFNMLGLFMFGIPVERRMGSKEFILYYLLTGTLAGILSFAVYMATGSGAMLLGASGALFAVELAFATLFPDAVVYLFGLIPIRAPIMVLGYTALELFFSFTGFQSGVAHFTHLFGFAAGWLYFVVRFGINPWNAFRGR